jgi:hypothetical protein
MDIYPLVRKFEVKSTGDIIIVDRPVIEFAMKIVELQRAINLKNTNVPLVLLKDRLDSHLSMFREELDLGGQYPTALQNAILNKVLKHM